MCSSQPPKGHSRMEQHPAPSRKIPPRPTSVPVHPYERKQVPTSLQVLAPREQQSPTNPQVFSDPRAQQPPTNHQVFSDPREQQPPPTNPQVFSDPREQQPPTNPQVFSDPREQQPPTNPKVFSDPREQLSPTNPQVFSDPREQLSPTNPQVFSDPREQLSPTSPRVFSYPREHQTPTGPQAFSYSREQQIPASPQISSPRGQQPLTSRQVSKDEREQLTPTSPQVLSDPREQQTRTSPQVFSDPREQQTPTSPQVLSDPREQQTRTSPQVFSDPREQQRPTSPQAFSDPREQQPLASHQFLPDARDRQQPTRYQVPPDVKEKPGRRVPPVPPSRQDVREQPPSTSRQDCSDAKRQHPHPIRQVPPSPHSGKVPADASVIQILLIGKSGNGKSSTGNSLLGQALFGVSAGINTCTKHTQLQEVTRTHNNSVFTLQVVDLPDVCNDMDDKQNAEEIKRCKTMTFPNPTVIGLVIRADVRFTPADYAIYRTTLQLLGRQPSPEELPRQAGKGRQPHKGKQGTEVIPAPNNLVIIFTKGDALSPEMQKSFGEDVQRTNKELKRVIQDAQDRFVLLSNQPSSSPNGGASPRAGSADDASPGLWRLLDIVLRVHRAHASEVKVLSAILLGATGTGKSATGNSLLYPSVRFAVQEGLSSATRSCETAVRQIAGLQLEVTDTPDWNGSGDVPTLSRQISSWLVHPHHAPHVLLWVLKAQDRFREHDSRFLAALKYALGKEITDRVLVVFTGGDHVAQSAATMEDLLRRAPEDLKRVLEEVENRYVLFNNEASSPTERLLQRNALLESMVCLVDRHQGRPLRKMLEKDGRRQQGPPKTPVEENRVVGRRALADSSPKPQNSFCILS